MSDEKFTAQKEEKAIKHMAYPFKRFGLLVKRTGSNYSIFQGGKRLSLIRVTDKRSSVQIIKQRLVEIRRVMVGY